MGAIKYADGTSLGVVQKRRIMDNVRFSAVSTLDITSPRGLSSEKAYEFLLSMDIEVVPAGDIMLQINGANTGASSYWQRNDTGAVALSFGLLMTMHSNGYGVACKSTLSRRVGGVSVFTSDGTQKGGGPFLWSRGGSIVEISTMRIAFANPYSGYLTVFEEEG
jgi:hypothetical protein